MAGRRHEAAGGGETDVDLPPCQGFRFSLAGILHIATALELEAKELLSFDANQNALAAAEGLQTPLAGV